MPARAEALRYLRGHTRREGRVSGPPLGPIDLQERLRGADSCIKSTTRPNPNMHPFAFSNHSRRSVLLVSVALAMATPWSAFAAKPSKAEIKEIKREFGPDAVEGKVSKRDDKTDAAIGKPAAGDADSRMMSKLREQFEVTDDAEWALIAERITKVSEMRRNFGAAMGVKGPVLGERKKPGARAESSLQNEQAALRTAVRDKLPDAEVKARLARVHEVYHQNEARLARAQAELRAVLTVRQEAMAVMAGLLTP